MLEKWGPFIWLKGVLVLAVVSMVMAFWIPWQAWSIYSLLKEDRGSCEFVGCATLVCTDPGSKA